MKALPHKGPRSRRRRKASTKRSAGDPKKCQVQPEIGVRVTKIGGWDQKRYAPAKIRLRRGCYRYLVWRDGLFKREFYLGKIKICTPQRDRGARGLAPARSAAADLESGVQK